MSESLSSNAPITLPSEPTQFYPLTMGETYDKAVCYDCEQNKKFADSINAQMSEPLPAVGAILDDPDPEYLCRRPLCREHASMHGVKFG